MMIPLKKRSPIFILFLLLIFIFFTSPSYSNDMSPASTPSASNESGDHAKDTERNESGHSTDRSADLLDLLFRFINFAVLIIILVIVIRKTRILGYFATRSEEIKKRLEDLKIDRDEVEKKYNEAEDRLKKIEEKSREIIDQYRKDGMAEKERIISAAKERVKQIIAQAEITIQREIESARSGLKQEIIELASQRAQGILSREIGDREQENMVDDFIEKMASKK
jgi:F-type H+-transporting ATPase subunit b